MTQNIPGSGQNSHHHERRAAGVRHHTESALEMLQYEIVASWLKARFQSERGASLVEYALLVALIAVVCIGAVTFLGNEAADGFSTVGNSIN